MNIRPVLHLEQVSTQRDRLNIEIAERLHSMFGTALGLTVHDFKDRTLDFCNHSIGHLALLEPSEVSKVVLQCCILKQFKLVLIRYEDIVTDPTIEQYCDVLQSVTDRFFDSIQSGHAINVKRAGSLAKPTITRAVVRVKDGIFDVAYV